MPETAPKKSVPRVPKLTLGEEIEQILAEQQGVYVNAHLMGLIRRREDALARWLERKGYIRSAETCIHQYRYPTAGRK